MINNKIITCICKKGTSQFIIPIIDYLSIKIKIGFIEYSTKANYIAQVFSSDIIFVEWATAAAKFISKIKRKHQFFIIRLHRYEFKDEKLMNSIKWQNVDLLIFVNDSLRKEFNKQYPNVKTLTIPNAVDCQKFRLTKRTKKNTLLTYSMHFTELKAYYELIKVFKRIISLDSNYHLTIATQKPMSKEHKQYYLKCCSLIEELEMADYVTIETLGPEKDAQEKIIYLLETHNAIISFSDIESFHYSFAEGLLSGLHGFCRGWRYPDPKEFWNKWCYTDEPSFIQGIIDWGCCNMQNRNETAKENRRYIINNFSKEIIGEKYYNHFLNNLKV